MLEEPKIKKVDKRDKQLPQNFEQLIEMYDVEKIWPYIKRTIDYINNDLEKVTVSPTEPTTNEKVWIQKGKNLFNKAFFDVLSGNYERCSYSFDENKRLTMIATETGGIAYVRTVSFYLPKGTYTFSCTTTGYFSNVILMDADTLQVIKDGNTNKIFNFSLEKDTSLFMYIYVNNSTVSNTMTIDNIQIEKGTEATEYEEYIEEKIWVKNDNGVYVLFKPENKPINITTGVEFETGRIIDGKKEYGKRINCGNLPNAGENAIAHGVNFSQLTRFDGLAVAYGSAYIPLPYLETNANSSYNIKLTFDATYIYLKSENNQSVWHAYVTIYYTKN